MPKDPNAPKRPMTTFFLFKEENWAAAKDKMPAGSLSKDIIVEVAKMWREIDAEGKARIEKLAATSKAKFEQEKADYRRKVADEKDWRNLKRLEQLSAKVKAKLEKEKVIYVEKAAGEAKVKLEKETVGEVGEEGGTDDFE